MHPLNILITNNTLACRWGTELYVRDIALCLKARGHKVVAYSSLLGEVAEELKRSGILVIDDLNNLTTDPDIIHGHHNLETLTALLQFPHTPAIFCCHGAIPWQEKPPVFSRIMRYLAVDYPCRDRLYNCGISPELINVIFNFVDLARFKQRPPLPLKPKRALVFSNNASDDNYVPQIRQACEQAGIELHVLGKSAGNASAEPEKVLVNYDLVFAKARAAIEALATGCAVITCDATGLGQMVTSANLTHLQTLNFGFSTLTRAQDPELIFREISNYSALDAAEVSKTIRKTADMELAVTAIEQLYQKALQEFSEIVINREQEEKEIACCLRWLTDMVKGAIYKNTDFEAQQLATQSLRQNCALQNSLLVTNTKLKTLKLQNEELNQQLAYQRLALTDKETDYQKILNSKSWKVTYPLRWLSNYLKR